MNYKIAGSTILYNPDPSVISNILSYLPQLELLFVINNSDRLLPAEFKELLMNSKVKFIENGRNVGIATALNIAVREAVNLDYDLLLTMDQDSIAETGMVTKLASFFSDEKVAVVSPRQESPLTPDKKPGSKNCKEVLTVMTSGNLVRLKHIIDTGGFRESFFIDYVDNEMCLRLVSKGFKVLFCEDIILRHSLGTETATKIFSRNVYPTNYSPLRYYYQARNRLYVIREFKRLYPSFVKEDRRNFGKRVIKMLFFEKEKLKKIKCIWMGYVHYIRNIQGKCPINL